MSGIELLTLAPTVAVTFIGVFLGVLINNNRLTDVNSRLNDVKELLRAEIHAESATTRMLMERNHSEILAKLIDMDGRILRLESQRLIQ